ncbi:MAG: hypothetical protein K9I94_12500 [Bacteroidales bacterium]|nr:hypothetical protein [Bacteroidales bacterium]
MRAYRYIAKISEKGTIQIPFNPAIYNREVEIIIVPKQPEKEKEMTATDFVNKWAGFLKENNTGKSKFDYLMRKYK